MTLSLFDLDIVKQEKSSEEIHVTIEGVIDSFVFCNEENGFTVMRLETKNDIVTATGFVAGINKGETVGIAGKWVNHPKFGKQIKFDNIEVKPPATVDGLKAYLGSGFINGIGECLASLIVDKYGMDTIDVIDKTPEKLLSISGIGEKRLKTISNSWNDSRKIREIMIFLQAYGVSMNLSIKIYKEYGNESIAIVRENPYRLSQDIYGIGFKTADKIAMKMGIPKNAPSRIHAGILYALENMSSEGHCYGYYEQLIENTIQLLEISGDLCSKQISTMISNGNIVVEEGKIYSSKLYRAECNAANNLSLLLNSNEDSFSEFQDTDWDEALSAIEQEIDITLTERQKEAVISTFINKVTVITGGPGTGKSTITKAVILLLDKFEKSISLAAPTGRAAKRLNEVTGRNASTIHRLLGLCPGMEEVFDTNISDDMVIIDESSMMDIILANSLLSRIDSGCHLVFIGDIDQLPSVGPGNVLRDMISNDAISTIRLDVIFRQSEDSFIILNAKRINQGLMPFFEKNSVDFFLFPETNPEKCTDRIIDLVSNRIPDKFGFRSSDIQVLSPMYRGKTGVTELNTRLQETLNPKQPGKDEKQHGERTFRIGDVVMQTRNNYFLNVFNGDIGNVDGIDSENQKMAVDFSGFVVEYPFGNIDELIHAFAISIHKSQGSEFPVIVLPLLTQHYIMLQRNLIYTAITRARKLVVIVGDKRAIGIAINNNQIEKRNTFLGNRIMKSCL